MKISSHQFLRDDNTPFPWRMASDFRLLHMFLHGESLDPVIAQRKSVGILGARVFGVKSSSKGYFNLAPTDYTDDQLMAFFSYLTDHTYACEFVVWTDNDVFKADPQGRLNAQAAVACRFPLVVIEAVNEWSQNGVDPSKLQKPYQLPCSAGSDVGDAPLIKPYWDYGTFHNRRELPKAFCRSYLANEAGWDIGLQGPFVFNEDLGADETDQPGRRSANPDVFAALASGAKAVGALSTFHSEAGVTSTLWGPTQLACATAWLKAHDRPALPDTLRVGQVRDWTSGDGSTFLTYQTDGNCVLYDRSGGKVLWASGTNQPGGQAIMQADGNFVVYGPTEAVWASNTDGHPGAGLLVEASRMRILDEKGQELWRSP